MSFHLKKTLGNHFLYDYSTVEHPFLEFFQKIFNTLELENIHLLSKEYELNKDNLEASNFANKDSDLHKIFYKNIKEDHTFKKIYCNFIKKIYNELFPNETVYIYQSFPSIRIQFFNSVVVPPHCDSDDLGKHPLGEKNFLIPITKMSNTNTIFIETEPEKGDFIPINMEYGNVFFFNGNKCIHYNKKNNENKVRISLDFRIILLEDYLKYINTNKITFTNPKDENRKSTKMIVGGYYQMCFKNNIDNIYDWTSQNDLILQSRPNFDENEALACYNYMHEGDNFVTEFKQTEQLEKMICDYIGCKYAIMTTSGTSALIISLLTLDLKDGDEVIVPNYTMIATINAIINAGGKPVIIDVDEKTFTLNKELIEKAITSKTKAVMHVSLNNRITNLEEIVSFCKDKNITLIEDSAQSLGCFYKNKHLGTYGKIGCFSLSTPKIISTGQGGFIVTDDEKLFKKMTMIKNFGRKCGGIDDFETFGLNFKFTDIQAVIGIEQMKKLKARVIRMKEIHDLYYNNLKELNIIKESNYDGWIPWFIDIIVDDRDDLINFLKIHNIQTRKTYPEINKTPMYLNEDELVNSKLISNYGLFLPSHTLLSNNQINYICNLIKIFYKYN